MRSKGVTGESRYAVPGLERGLRVLEVLAGHPGGLGQSEIAARLGCSRSSTFRLVMTLEGQGYIERDEEGKVFRLSRKLLGMSAALLGEPDLLSTAREVMGELRDAVGETVLIGTLAEGALVVLGQALGRHYFKFAVDIGTRLPLHTAAPAKAILAWLPEAEREKQMAGVSFEKFNSRTLTSVQALIKELQKARRLGYAVDQGEQLTGIHCVAAPLFNAQEYPVAAIWATGPRDRMPERELGRLGVLVREHADRISARLGRRAGWPPPAKAGSDMESLWKTI